MSEAIRTEIFPSTAITAGAASAGFSIPTASHLVILIDVTAYATTGPVFFLQVSDDGGTTWFNYPMDLTMFGSVAPGVNKESLATTAVGKYLMLARNIPADRFRLLWTVAGGSATFSAVAIAK